MDEKWLKLKDKFFLKEMEIRSDSSEYFGFICLYVLYIYIIVV